MRKTGIKASNLLCKCIKIKCYQQSLDTSTVKLKPRLPKVWTFSVQSFFSHSMAMFKDFILSKYTALLGVNPRKQSYFNLPLQDYRGLQDCLQTVL